MAKHYTTHPNAVLYCQLMEYIKWRLEAVAKTLLILKQGRHYLDNRLAADFCLLQLRFCCELLAVGCMAIHTDVPQANHLQKQWNAERIMKAFEKLKSQFFPKPVRDEIRNDGMIIHVPITDALTRNELLKMYNFFGERLHTGTFKGYKNSETHAYNFETLEEFISKLMKLLSSHTYTLHDGDKIIRVIMKNEHGQVWLDQLDKVGEMKPHSSPSSDHH